MSQSGCFIIIIIKSSPSSLSLSSSLSFKKADRNGQHVQPAIQLLFRTKLSKPSVETDLKKAWTHKRVPAQKISPTFTTLRDTAGNQIPKTRSSLYCIVFNLSFINYVYHAKYLWMNGFLTRKNCSQWNSYLCNLPVMFPRPTITLDSLFSRKYLRNLDLSPESLIAFISKSFQLKLSMISITLGKILSARMWRLDAIRFHLALTSSRIKLML